MLTQPNSIQIAKVSFVEEREWWWAVKLKLLLVSMEVMKFQKRKQLELVMSFPTLLSKD